MTTLVPEIVKDAISREVNAPFVPVGHYVHPSDPSGRTALCDAPILGIPAFEPFETCPKCILLRGQEQS